MGWLDGKVALITGGGSGIGRGTVGAFVNEGARVAVLEFSPAKAAGLRSELGAAVHVVEGDATLLADNERAVEETVGAFGKLDALITFPGIFDGQIPLLNMPGDKLSDAFDELFAVNVKSDVLSAKAALPHLLESGGNIIFTVSNAGFYPDGGGCLYTASKFAVRGLVTQLAYELAPKVRVNGVSPGGTRTEIRGVRSFGLDEPIYARMPPDVRLGQSNPLQLEGKPEDHAWAYVYLASNERARLVTGTILPTDGGLGVRGMRKPGGLL